MKLKSVYVCSNCGETSPRWMGRCPSCGSWNTMNEDVVAETPKAGLSGGKSAAPVRQEGVTSLTAKRLADISTTEEKSRILTGISELDRVLGGGIVLGGVEYEKSAVLRKVLDQLIDGTLQQGRTFSELYHALLFGDNNNMAEPYLVLKDFPDYARVQERIGRLYGTRQWWRSAVINVAQSGFFASDRTITEYNDRIWHLKRLHK